MPASRVRQIVLSLLVLAAVIAAAPGPSVTVVGNAFHVTLPDGTVLAQDQLPGAILNLGDGSGAQRRIRIDAVEHDPRDPTGEVVLYALSEQIAGGDWVNACQPDPDGRRLGFPLPGAFTPDGTYQPTHPGILVTCTGGAEGKCVRFGYKPWRTTPAGEPLLPYYQTCVRLVRADYGGDGVGHTRNGTPIDLFDRIGIQKDETAPGMTFEAAFGPAGAVCVSHPRLSEVVTLSALMQQYPRLARGADTVCDDTVSALLFVRSFGFATPPDTHPGQSSQ